MIDPSRAVTRASRSDRSPDSRSTGTIPRQPLSRSTSTTISSLKILIGN
jgi:hypothetical protein